MKIKSSCQVLIAVLIAVFGFSLTAKAQISAGGITTRASSQLVFWYDAEIISTNGPRITGVQVTNTSDSDPVEIHIQIYQTTGDGVSVNNTVRCVEADFNDVLTPNDTHMYIMANIVLNQGEIDTPAPVPDVLGTKGFVVVTPVVGSGDNTAISFQHLTGHSAVFNIAGGAYRVNAVGRDAVNLSNGSILAQSTVLDGVSTGYQRLQPEEVVFNFTNADTYGGLTNWDVVAITFADEFGPPGLLGYRAVPGNASLSPFLFDYAEVPGSCPIATNECFNNWGLNLQFPAFNETIDPGINICSAVTLPPDPLGNITGWSRLFVSNLESSENLLVLVNGSNTAATSQQPTQTVGRADWSNVVGLPINIVPPDECSNLPAECSNPVCKPLAGCENPDGVDPDGVNFCQDGVDNDGVNGTDCQDFGCDGFVAITSEEGDPTGPCESAGETSCADEFDNDANGFVDCGLLGGEPDPNCVAIGACGDDDDDDDDGGNCSLAGPVATGTAAANFLLPLLPLAGAYALRRIRRRNNK